MLYANELSEIFKLVSNNERPHLTFVREYLKEWGTKNIPGYQQLYFINKYNGVKQVFPKQVVLPAFKQLKEIMNEPNLLYKIKVNGKEYSVKRLQEDI